MCFLAFPSNSGRISREYRTRQLTCFQAESTIFGGGHPPSESSSQIPWSCGYNVEIMRLCGNTRVCIPSVLFRVPPSVLATCLGSRALPQMIDTENSLLFKKVPAPYKTHKWGFLSQSYHSNHFLTLSSIYMKNYTYVGMQTEELECMVAEFSRVICYWEKN